MDTNREMALRELMAAEFTAIDLNLYLDTHPNDARAIALLNSSVQRADMLRSNFENMYGPLTAATINRTNVWEWNKGPWPWEKYWVYYR